jgi:hypothetical protein
LLVAERALSCFLQLEVNGNDRCSIAGTQAQAEKDITQALDEAHRAFKQLRVALISPESWRTACAFSFLALARGPSVSKVRTVPEVSPSVE